jgi:putative oxidoreductase
MLLHGKEKLQHDLVKSVPYRSRVLRHGIGAILSVFADRGPLSQTVVASSVGRWAAIPLRLIVGYGFLQHGFAKLLRGSDNFRHTACYRDADAGCSRVADHRDGNRQQPMRALGALVPIVRVPMVIVLLVAIFTVHLPNGFCSTKLQTITSTGAHFGQLRIAL